MSEWKIAHADANLTYGGLFVRDEGYWADIVNVEDLADCGAENMVLVEKGSVSYDHRNLRQSRAEFRSAVVGCGPGWHGEWKITGMSRENARLLAHAALWEYGYKDRDEVNVLTTDREFSQPRDGKFTITGRVNGEKGLWRWLRRQYDIEREA
jgi:hypothetical protein